LLPVGSKKPSALGLQGGVVKMGRVVWAKELKYLHAHVDNSTDGWGVLISTNKGNKERATITDDPGVPNASIELDIAVDKKGKSVEVVTPAEVARLKKLVRDWVAHARTMSLSLTTTTTPTFLEAVVLMAAAVIGMQMWGAAAQVTAAVVLDV